VKHPALLVLCVLVAGCVQSSAASSSLDRFDALAGALRTTTHLSISVAADVHAINQAMAHDRKGQIKRSAARLGQDAARLERTSIRLQGKVARIMRAESTGLERQYLGLTLGTLWHQRWEAHWAARLARTVRRDPLLLSQPRYAAALHQSREARRAAGASVSDANRARTLRAHHPGDFGLATPRAGGQQRNSGGSGQ
jgi:hypothetical protein